MNISDFIVFENNPVNWYKLLSVKFENDTVFFSTQKNLYPVFHVYTV